MGAELTGSSLRERRAEGWLVHEEVADLHPVDEDHRDSLQVRAVQGIVILDVHRGERRAVLGEQRRQLGSASSHRWQPGRP